MANTTNYKSLTCPNCRATMLYDPQYASVQCPYCSTYINTNDLSGESDAVKLERMRLDAQKEIVQQQQQTTTYQMLYQQELERQKRLEEKAEKFKKGALFKILIAAAIISFLATLGSFTNANIIGGILGFLQTALFVVAILMGLQVIPELFNNMHIVGAIVAFAFIIPVVTIPSAIMKAVVYAKTPWNSLVLSDHLPDPPKKKVQVVSDSDTSLWVVVDKVSQTDYDKYIEKCKSGNYAYAMSNSTYGSDGYNDHGDHLDLEYDPVRKKLSIDLDVLEDFGELKWPSRGMATKLPSPDTSQGKVSSDSDGFFHADVVMSKEAFESYIEKCADLGFVEEYRKGDDYYYADDADGYHLSLNYKEIDRVSIQLREPDEEPEEEIEEEENTEEEPEQVTKEAVPEEPVNEPEISNTPAEEPVETVQPESPKSGEEIPAVTDTESTSNEKNNTEIDQSQLRPEVKKAIDSYEQYLDSLLDLIANSDRNNIIVIGKIIKAYGTALKMAKDFDAIDDTNDLTEAETIYFLEVQARCTIKMVQVANAMNEINGTGSN